MAGRCRRRIESCWHTIAPRAFRYSERDDTTASHDAAADHRLSGGTSNGKQRKCAS